jgi:hypothetical protein
MTLSFQLFIEAGIAGIIFVAILMLAGLLGDKTKLFDAYDGCSDRTKMNMTVFILGALGHIANEMLGINRYYCQFGVAATSGGED